MDPLFADGKLYYWKSLFSKGLSDDFIDAVVNLYEDRASPQTLFALRALGGAMGRVPEDATAYAHRDAAFNISIDHTWRDRNRSDEMIAWARAAWSDLRDRTGGDVYLNFAGFGEDNDTLVRSIYGVNYDRLATVKRRYDPTNLFRGNLNVAP